MNSIRARLLLWLISSVLITTLVVGYLTARLTWSGFNNVRDLGLEQIAQTVMRHDETPAPPAAAAPPPPTGQGWLDDEEDLDQFVSQIWDNAGELIYSSLPNVGPPLQTPGHHIVTWQGQSWRLYTLRQERRTVQVAVTTEIRRQHFYDLMPWLLVPLALLVTTLGLLMQAGVNRALRPLEDLRSDIEQRGSDGLQAIHTQGLPVEIAPLAQTLNELLSRVDTLLTSQRRFLADAAHELNTPLAAVKLQAQLARRVSPAEWPAALDELDAGIERATRLSSQLLQLARLEPDARQPMLAPVQLDDLLRQAVSAFSARAEHLGGDLGLAGAATVSLNGDPHALRTLVDNLIDNALNHATAPVRIDVSLRVEGHWAVLEVSDTGPGISAADRERVMERFVRLSPGDGKGSGLGLSIVREIAELHGARLELDDTPGGGLTVRVRLPLTGIPPPAAP
ncbi:MAG: sensor histidine kinase N-terminal domain-containing protein [Hydrogenophaga sp.]|uniref:sensor histidine kinase n=1 Tax=Hydrogenophaga sp. TaxID=1904254 RepID=UPI0025C60E53|nr:ATP-binding protein [Hydrogenophaga sp.]MBT9550471.1 sensor histidine kinase N-terminal domain-containing protein [Hydrogenophaga sp.]